MTEPAVQPNIQHIWCSATITKKMEDVFTGFINNQAQLGKNITEYVVYLSTVGGSPFSAIALYNFIKSIPQKTTIYNMGDVCSAGVTFFLAFEKRLGVPNCRFMVHQTSMSRNVLPENFNVTDLETQKTALLATDKNTQKIIHSETSAHAKKALTPESIRKAFLKSASYGATEALSHGFIEDIQLPRLPETGVIYITDQYLATLAG
jgi:ATP-dependent protease ClpP protease subunit